MVHMDDESTITMNIDNMLADFDLEQHIMGPTYASRSHT